MQTSSDYAAWVRDKASWMVGIWLVVFGVLRWSGGVSRFQAPSLAPARYAADLVNVPAPVLWGTLAILCGLLVFPYRTRRGGLYGGGFYALFYGFGMLIARLHDATTDGSGFSTYLFLVVPLCFGLGVLEEQRRTPVDLS